MDLERWAVFGLALSARFENALEPERGVYAASTSLGFAGRSGINAALRRFSTHALRGLNRRFNSHLTSLVRAAMMGKDEGVASVPMADEADCAGPLCPLRGQTQALRGVVRRVPDGRPGAAATADRVAALAQGQARKAAESERNPKEGRKPNAEGAAGGGGVSRAGGWSAGPSACN